MCLALELSLELQGTIAEPSLWCQILVHALCKLPMLILTAGIQNDVVILFNRQGNEAEKQSAPEVIRLVKAESHPEHPSGMPQSSAPAPIGTGSVQDYAPRRPSSSGDLYQERGGRARTGSSEPRTRPTRLLHELIRM